MIEEKRCTFRHEMFSEPDTWCGDGTDECWVSEVRNYGSIASPKYFCLFHAPNDVKPIDAEEWSEDEIASKQSSALLLLLVKWNEHNKHKKDKSMLRAIGFNIGDIDLQNFEFSYSIDFHKSCFRGVALFDNAIFNGNAGFYEAIFKKSAYFENVKFKGQTSFNKVQFIQTASFENTYFKFDAGFSATFNGFTDYKNSIFKRNATFSNSVFKNSAYFSSVTFNRFALFDKCKMKSISDFGGSQFHNITRFDSTNFTGEVRFNNTSFLYSTHFSDSIFESNSSFERAIFEHRVRFSKTVFDGPAWFDNTAFKRHAWFEGAHFSNYAGFRDVCFDSKSNFNNAKFLTTVTFRRATFNIAPKFHNAELHQDIDFLNTNFSDKSSSDAARAYRTLKLAMANVRSSTEESKFYALEQESLITQPGTPMRDKIFSHLYRKASNYGQDYKIPMLWVIAITLFFIIPYLLFAQWSGALDPVNGYKPADIYEFSTAQMLKPFSVWISNSSNQVSELFGPYARIVKWITLLHSILTSACITLFILAVRRRFKMN